MLLTEQQLKEDADTGRSLQTALRSGSFGSMLNANIVCSVLSILLTNVCISTPPSFIWTLFPFHSVPHYQVPVCPSVLSITCPSSDLGLLARMAEGCVSVHGITGGGDSNK